LVVLWNQASYTVSEIFDIEYNTMVDMTLKVKRPLNEHQGHSFWYQLIFLPRDALQCTARYCGYCVCVRFGVSQRALLSPFKLLF